MFTHRAAKVLVLASLAIIPLLATSTAKAQSPANNAKASRKPIKPSYRPGGTNHGYQTATSAKAARSARTRAHRAQAMRQYNVALNNFGTAVAGGNYLPGYGVIGNPGVPVFGGTYIPGFGVTGIQPTPVHGGTYMPGYGVSGVGAQQVHGGTYIPGYGVRK